MAHEFVAAHPHWAIARNPLEARAARKAGKNILVFSLEEAGGVLEEEADLKEFIDDGGISIVTFAHLIDDELSVAALMSGHQALANASQSTELWDDLAKAQAPSRENQKNGVDNFISIWEKVRP